MFLLLQTLQSGVGTRFQWPNFRDRSLESVFLIGKFLDAGVKIMNTTAYLIRLPNEYKTCSPSHGRKVFTVG